MVEENEITYFEIFPWDKNFETGIELIDQQHKVLVNILNKLAAHLANLSGSIVLNEIFDELIAYTDYHFKTEEGIWVSYFAGDEWYTSHEATHGTFIEEVLALKNNDKQKHLDDVVHDIVTFLSKWLAYHILDTDKRMAKAALAITSGSSIEEAKIISNAEMTGSMKVLIQTVLSMYESISSRTMDLMREKSLRRQAEEALSRSEERWKFILDGGVENVWDWDIENNTISRSDQDTALFEIISHHLKGNEEGSTIHPLDIEQFKADFEAHMEGQSEFFSNKHRLLRENGSWSWVLSRGKVVSRNSSNKALRMIGTHSDITEREMAAEIYRNSRQAIFITDIIKPPTKYLNYAIISAWKKEMQEH
jgi:hemerythrin-like metal-binding protein/PAS domain S-box-containing protein